MINISYRQLRNTIGVLGILLPLAVFIHTKIVSKCHLQDSISHYYYTSGNGWFIGILWMLGLVLIYYPNHPTNTKNYDGVLTTISGFCAIGVAMVPTNANSSDGCELFKYCDSNLRAGMHYSFAAILLLIFSYISAFIFTKSSLDKKNLKYLNIWKWRRNLIYRICSAITFLSVLCIAILAIIDNSGNLPLEFRKYTFWLEVTALVPFGVAWLVKGDFILTDVNVDSISVSFGKKIIKKFT